ncbi:hypothetical protein JCM18899A_30750 [Nocardioides sp. AN3]
MRRGLWFLAGAGVGVYAMVRGRRAAEALTSDGLHDRWQALGLGARMFRDEVATGKAEAEASLRQRLRTRGLDTPSLVPRQGSSTDEVEGLDTPSLVPREGYSTNEVTAREGSSTNEDNDPEKQEGPQ